MDETHEPDVSAQLGAPGCADGDRNGRAPLPGRRWTPTLLPDPLKVLLVGCGILLLIIGAVMGRPGRPSGVPPQAMLDADVRGAMAFYVPLLLDEDFGSWGKLLEQAAAELSGLAGPDISAEVALRLVALDVLAGDSGTADSHLRGRGHSDDPAWLGKLRAALRPHADAASQREAAQALKGVRPAWAAAALRKYLYEQARDPEAVTAEIASTRRLAAQALVRFGLVGLTMGCILLFGPFILAGYLVWFASRPPAVEPLEPAPQAFPWTVLDGLAGAALMLVASAVVSSVWSAATGASTYADVGVPGVLLSYLAAIAVVGLTVLFTPVWPAREAATALALRNVGIGRAVLWGSAGLVAMYPLVALVGLFVSRLLGGEQRAESTNPILEIVFTAHGVIPVAVLLILVAVLAPAFEETLFRGCLYGALRARMSAVRAAVWSSVAFALLHLDWYVLPQLILIGLMLAHIRERTGSVYPGMVAHGLLNGGQVLVILLLRGL